MAQPAAGMTHEQRAATVEKPHGEAMWHQTTGAHEAVLTMLRLELQAFEADRVFAAAYTQDLDGLVDALASYTWQHAAAKPLFERAVALRLWIIGTAPA
jgi:hypothetical protein